LRHLVPEFSGRTSITEAVATFVRSRGDGNGIGDAIAHGLTAVIVLSVFYAIGYRVNWIAGAIGGMVLVAD